MCNVFPPNFLEDGSLVLYKVNLLIVLSKTLPFLFPWVPLINCLKMCLQISEIFFFGFTVDFLFYSIV